MTGGCGFLGSALVHRLVTLGVPLIRIVDDLRSGSAKALPVGGWKEAYLPDLEAVWAPGVLLVRAAVEDRAAFGRCAEGADVIVHLAAGPGPADPLGDPFRDLEVGVGGVLSVLEAARLRGVSRVVLAEGGGLPVDSASGEGVERAPRTVEAAGRLACEAYAEAYHHQFGLETISLRFGRAWGVTHLPDLVDGLVRAASVPGLGGRVLLLANGSGSSADTTPADHLHTCEAAARP